MAIARQFRVQLLDELLVVRDGVLTPLPQSRKTRALLAYLALADRPLRRDELCELLWDVPGDPRAALRWSLTKLRTLLRTDTMVALKTDRDLVNLDFDLLSVDLLEIRTLMHGGPDGLPDELLSDCENRLGAGCLNGLDDAGTRRFQLWLEAERKSVLELHCRVISELMSRATLSATERLRLAGKKVALDPLNDASNIEHLGLILQSGGFREAQQAFYKARDYYRSERLDDSELTAAWASIVPPGNKRVDEERSAAIATSGDDVAERSTAMPDKPSLAVLDFRDLGSNGAIFARGLTADLNSRLAHLPSLFVIARQSSATIETERLTPRQIGTRLGVRYLLGGSIQREQRRIRITVTLTDTTDESEFWSEQYDRPLDDVFQVQDDITSNVIAAIEPEIERAEMQRALLKPPDSLSAWEFFHRGLWHCFRFTVRDNEIAHRFFAQAISLDPYFSRAFAGISFTHYSRAFLSAVPDVHGEITKALEAGTRSVGFDGRDAMGHWAVGRALYLSREHDESLAAIDRALALNPSYAQGHYAKGFVGIHAGLGEASVAALDMAQRLSPFDPLLFAMKASRGILLASQHRYDEAVAWAIRATHEPNAHFHIYAIAAACLELAGRSADARNNAGWVIERQPQYSVEVFRRSFPHKDEAAREPMLAALARSGIPRAN